jgi:hypothetical protein
MRKGEKFLVDRYRSALRHIATKGECICGTATPYVWIRIPRSKDRLDHDVSCNRVTAHLALHPDWQVPEEPNWEVIFRPQQIRPFPPLPDPFRVEGAN